MPTVPREPRRLPEAVERVIAAAPWDLASPDVAAMLRRLVEDVALAADEAARAEIAAKLQAIPEVYGRRDTVSRRRVMDVISPPGRVS